MFTKSFALIAATAALSVSALSIDTPARLTQCDTVEIKWSGKNAPFILSVLPSCDSDSEDPLLEFTGVNTTAYKWTVNLPSSTGAVAFAITDNKGNEAYTDEVTIQKSDNGACLLGASPTAANPAGTPTATADGTNPEVSRTATGTPSSTATPTAPINFGSNGSGLNNSGSSSGTTDENANTSGAIVPVASSFVGIVGVAAALLVSL